MIEPILTPRLKLRPVALSDAEPSARLMSPDIARWTGSWKGRNTAEEVAERIGRVQAMQGQGQVFHQVIERREDGELIGWIAVVVVDASERRGALGYWIGEAYFGQGYIREAAAAIMARAWDVLPVDVIEGVAQTANVASIAVLRGLGMRHRGQRMEFATARGAADLCEIYEIGRPGARP